MNYTYEPNNKKFFATQLRRMGDKVKWASNDGGTTLVVQCPFSEDIEARMPELCAYLNETNPDLTGDFALLGTAFPGISMRLMDARAKAREGGGCKLAGAVCRVAVFAARISGDTCTIYEPNKHFTVDIPVEITVGYERVMDTRTKGVFRRKEEKEFSGFYEVWFENKKVANYRDGSIYYTVNQINIPVTAQMIQADQFYIKNPQMPELKSSGEGYHITMKENV